MNDLDILENELAKRRRENPPIGCGTNHFYCTEGKVEKCMYCGKEKPGVSPVEK